MSFFHAQQSVFRGPQGVVPFVSDIVISSTVASGIANAAIVFSPSALGAGPWTNNQLLKQHSVASYSLMGNDDATVPVDHTGEPWASAVTGSEWEVACISEDIGTWDFPHAAVGVYTSFATTDMRWREQRPGAKSYTPGTDRCVATFRIREVAVPSNFVDFEVDCSAIQT